MMRWSDALELDAADSRVDWSTADLAAMLRDQLAMRINGDGSSTFADVLHSPGSELRGIDELERFCADIPAEGPPLPAAVMEVLRLMCRAARARQGLLPLDGDIGVRLCAALACAWLDDKTRDLLVEMQAKLGDSADGSDQVYIAHDAKRIEAPGGAAPEKRGRYVMEREHARGGLGLLSVARDLDLGRQVALKEIRPELRGDAASRGRFVREAQITGQLEHPNIVPVYALGRDEHGDPYYAMRFVGGKTLGHAIAEYHSEKTDDSRSMLRELLRRFEDVCRAVAYAHSRGIVHRDLKPSNIMLGDFGETWIVDWGIAKRTSEVEAAVGEADTWLPVQGEHTLAGQSLGTPRYMSPEQAEDPRKATPASDIFSLGAILFEVVTGQPPRAHQGEGVELSWRGAVNVRPLQSICRRALAARPADRYGSASELAMEVERWLADEPVAAHRESIVQSSSRWARRHRSLVLGAIALLVTVAVMLSVNNIFIRHERDLKATALHDRQEALGTAQRNERVAQERLANGLVLSADGLLAEGRAPEAMSRYGEAQGMLRSLGMSDVGAVAGMLDTHIRSPRPLVSRHYQLPADTTPWFPRDTVGIARDGRSILVAGSDGSATLIDLLTGVKLRRFQGHNGVVRAVVLSPDAKTAYTGGDDGVFNVWDATSGNLIFSGHGHGKALRWITPGPSGGLVLTAGDDHKIVLWDVIAGKQVRTFEGHNPVNEHVEGMQIFADGHTVASGLHTTEILIWDLNDGKELRRLRGHTWCTANTVISPDGRTIYSGSGNDVSLRSWDVESGKPLLSMFSEAPTGFSDMVVSDVLLVAGNDGVLRMRNPITGDLLGSRFGVRSAIDEMRGMLGGRTAITKNIVGDVALWDLQEQTDLAKLTGHNAPVLHATCSPDGLLLATAGSDGTVRVWDRATRRELRRFATPLKVATAAAVVEYWRVASVVAFDPTGTHLYTGAGDGNVVQWSLQTGKELHRFARHGGFVNGIAVSGDGKRVAVCGIDRAVTVWEPETGAMTPLKEHTGLLDGTQISRDGRTVLVNDTSGQVAIWDVATKKIRGKLKANDQGIRCAAFSPNDRRVVSGGADGVVRVWDLDSGKEIWSAMGHQVIVYGVAFSPDGKTVTSGGEDKIVRVWDAASGLEEHAFAFFKGPVKSVCFTPDGSTIVAASMDGTVALLDLSRPGTYEQFGKRLAEADARLQLDGSDAGALNELGEWYAFRGADEIAAGLLQEVAAQKESAPRLTLARCLWRLGRTTEARQQLELATKRAEAPAGYLSLCMRGCTEAPLPQ